MRHAPAFTPGSRLARSRLAGWCVLLALLVGNLPAQLAGLWSSGPAWIEVCGPQGMRWVSASERDDQLPAVLKSDCVWATAHVGLEPVEPVSVPQRPLRRGGGPAWWPGPDITAHDAWRVLLMAPMRAPPLADLA